MAIRVLSIIKGYSLLSGCTKYSANIFLSPRKIMLRVRRWHHRSFILLTCYYVTMSLNQLLCLHPQRYKNKRSLKPFGYRLLPFSRDYWTRTSDLAPPRRVPFWTYPALYQGLEPYCNNSVDFVVDFSLPNDLT